LDQRAICAGDLGALCTELVRAIRAGNQMSSQPDTVTPGLWNTFNSQFGLSASLFLAAALIPVFIGVGVRLYWPHLSSI
jgi:hypothetical protein